MSASAAQRGPEWNSGHFQDGRRERGDLGEGTGVRRGWNGETWEKGRVEGDGMARETWEKGWVEGDGTAGETGEKGRVEEDGTAGETGEKEWAELRG